ncbi:MAG: sigma-70 family RNA polymerase sigma factor [Planctomycetota bacterium]
MHDLRQAVIEMLPDLQAELQRTMHRSLKERLPVSDVIQETCLKALEHLETFEYRNEASLRAWLRVIARNVVRGKIRLKSHCSELGEFANSIIESGILRPSELIRQRETVEIVQVAILRLPETHRELLMMRYVECATFEEIARLTGESPSCIRGRHRNAIDMLTRMCRESDITSDEDAGERSTP